MIEIILRDDIKDYEPHPFLGFTYRQLVTGALIIAAGVSLGLGLTALGVPNTIMTVCDLAVCGVIGFIGLGRVRGLKGSDYLKIKLDNSLWKKTIVFSPPQISPFSERNKEVEHIEKDAVKEVEKDQLESYLEIEIEEEV